MPTKNYGQAIKSYTEILGHEFVITDSKMLLQAQAATFKTAQSILGILKPQSVKEISEIVKVARQHKSPLYTISTGKNWGFGSRIPVKDGSFLLELSRMNRILDFDGEQGYVTIEPGVTQKQLYQFLRSKKSRFSLGPTGSAPDTSIVGNVCERGYGDGPYYFRAHYVSELELMLPSGKCVHTGYGRFSNAQAAAVYREGLGPSFTDMFIQSNLGIITKMTLLLAPTPAYKQYIDMYVPAGKDLPAFLKIVHDFNLFTNSKKAVAFHNDLKMLSEETQYPWDQTDGKTPLPAEALTVIKKKCNINYTWWGMVEMYGHTKQEVDAQLTYFKSLAGKVDGLDVSPVYSAEVEDYRPENIRNDPYWRMKTKPPQNKNPDKDGCGYIRVSVAVPFAAKNIMEVIDTIKKIIAQFGLEPFISIYCITERSVLVATSVMFDRTTKGEDAKALRCHDMLLNSLMSLGYYPNRLSTRAMPLIPKSIDDYDDFQAAIKQAIDPDDIFSPGRYEVRS